MTRYVLTPAPALIAALEAVRAGVTSISVSGIISNVDGFLECHLHLTSGRVLTLCAAQHQVEERFEVFPINITAPSALAPVHARPLHLAGPVAVVLLQTEEWLDPRIPCGHSVGRAPVMQCQGPPGQAPASAAAVCTYVGGIRLIGSNGVSLVVVTLPFPLTLLVSAFADSSTFQQHAYTALDASGA